LRLESVNFIAAAIGFPVRDSDYPRSLIVTHLLHTLLNKLLHYIAVTKFRFAPAYQSKLSILWNEHGNARNLFYLPARGRVAECEAGRL
jgi:hypothetical protein